MKYFFCATMMISCLTYGSMLAMQRIVSPVTQKIIPSLMVRHCSSNQDKATGVGLNQRADFLKDIKGATGAKSDFIFYAYLGTLLFVACLPKPRPTHDRHFRPR